MKMGRSALGGMGIALAAILFVAINALAGPLLQGLRLDLTSDKLFTLSQGTRAILGRIDEPVTLRFYYSERLGREIPSYGVYAVRVREMLEEYRDAARGKLRLQIIDPPPFSDEEDRAVAFGLQAVPLNQQGETVYFGLAGSNTADKEESIAFFQPDRERFLEYDLTKLVYNLATPKKPVVGLMTMIPMAGEFRSMRPTPPSAVYSQLTQFFEVRGIEPNATEIPADIGVLMLVHPKELPESTLYAIDQFAMRGGRLLVFVDPHAESDAARGGPAAMGGNTGSDLKKIFDAWGIEMAPGKLAGDRQVARRVNAGTEGRMRAVDYVLWLTLRDTNFDKSDILLSEASIIQAASVGILSKKEGAAIGFQPLIRSSTDSEAIEADKVRTQPDPVQLYQDFKPSGESFVLAARLHGAVNSAFDARPAPAEGEKAPENAPAHLAKSQSDLNAIVVADTDLLDDRFWVTTQDFFGQRVAVPAAYNGDFVVNAVDNLLGSSELIGLRGRGLSQRPFTALQSIQRDAEARFRAKERALQEKLKETEQRLAQLQGRGAAGEQANRAIAGPEQQAEIEKFRAELVGFRRELRDVQAQLRGDIERVEIATKAVNIAAVPVAIAILALVLGWLRIRRRRPAAN
ncbi:MAG: Gldg family protein [Alphaproteobacteria bacterium]|nr:Gldg family protein [Alphaproteobacteria bacterium]